MSREARATPRPPSLVRALRRETVARHRRSEASIALGRGHSGRSRPGGAGGAATRSEGRRAISVLTDGPFFGGSVSDLRSAAAEVAVPVLRKDFILDELQVVEARAAGAAAVLLIVRALPRERLEALLACARGEELDALVEVHTAAELDVALEAGAADRRGQQPGSRHLPDRHRGGAGSCSGGSRRTRSRSRRAEWPSCPTSSRAAAAGRRRGADRHGPLGRRPTRRRCSTSSPGCPDMAVEVKICGLTRPEDAAAAAAAGRGLPGRRFCWRSPAWSRRTRRPRSYAAAGAFRSSASSVTRPVAEILRRRSRPGSERRPAAWSLRLRDRGPASRGGSSGLAGRANCEPPRPRRAWPKSRCHADAVLVEPRVPARGRRWRRRRSTSALAREARSRLAGIRWCWPADSRPRPSRTRWPSFVPTSWM